MEISRDRSPSKPIPSPLPSVPPSVDGLVSDGRLREEALAEALQSVPMLEAVRGDVAQAATGEAAMDAVAERQEAAALHAGSLAGRFARVPRGDRHSGGDSSSGSSWSLRGRLKFNIAHLGVSLLGKRRRLRRPTVARVLKLLGRQLLYFTLLLPTTLAVSAHVEDPLRPQWRVWLLRPLYALVGARIAVSVFYGIFFMDVVVLNMPEPVLRFVGSYAGWPSSCIVWLGAMFEFMFGASAATGPDREAWRVLRLTRFFLGVLLWLLFLAITRGALSAVLDSQFSQAHADRYETRTREALFTLRVLRALSARARMAKMYLAMGHQTLSQVADLVVEEDGAPGVEPSPQVPEADAVPLDAPVDAELNAGAHKQSVRHRLALLIAALDARGSGVASTLASARSKAVSEFGALYDYADEDERGEERTIKVSALQAWVLEALEPRTAAGRARVSAKVATLAGVNADEVGEDAFKEMAARSYKEIRYIKASVEAFSALNRKVAAAAIVLWALILLIAGIALVDWGFDMEQWIIPFSSTFLAVAAILGRVPYELMAGVLWVLVAQPYDIGDMVTITAVGDTSEVTSLVVSEIHALSTTFMRWNGDQHVLWNWEVRNANTINYTRSSEPLILVSFCVPTTVGAEDLTSIMDFVRQYTENVSKDWVSGSAVVSDADYLSGLMRMTVVMRSVFGRHEEGKTMDATSRFLIVLHGYLRAIGVEYSEPTQPLITFGYGEGADAYFT